MDKEMESIDARINITPDKVVKLLSYFHNTSEDETRTAIITDWYTQNYRAVWDIISIIDGLKEKWSPKLTLRKRVCR